MKPRQGIGSLTMILIDYSSGEQEDQGGAGSYVAAFASLDWFA
jgi:hypothetical protein